MSSPTPSPTRPVSDPAVIQRWAAACAGHDGEPLTDKESELIRIVEARFTADLPELWDVFEPSLTADARGGAALRFSYGFPRRTAEEAERAATAMARPFGDAAVAAATKVARALSHPATQQIMFGYARAAGRTTEGLRARVAPPPPANRVKLYLMMRDGETTAALDLARRILGYDGPLSSDALPLHAVGIDVGATGMVGAKLYFHRVEASAQEAQQWFGVAAPLRNLLLIHRLSGPDDPKAEHPSEIDMDPVENGLTWAQLRETEPIRSSIAMLSILDDLSSEFDVDVRRVTVGVPPASKQTVYYLVR